MNSSSMSDSLLATLLASGKIPGISNTSYSPHSTEEASGSSLIERVLQLSGAYSGVPNSHLLRLQGLSNSVTSPGASSPGLNTGAGGYGLSQSELLQALQADQNHAQLAALAEKLRQQGQGSTPSFMNRLSSVDKLLGRDQDAVNLSLGLANDMHANAFHPNSGNAAGVGSFRQSSHGHPNSDSKVRIMGVDINQSLGLGHSAQRRAEDALHLELLKRKDEFANLKESSDMSEGNEDDNPSRKKMRLSRQQSMYLEQKFYNQESLSAAQKAQVAKELGLLPRQVEVWFQNRRARRRLKQAEMDCEILRKSCKALQEENLRLMNELRTLQKGGEQEGSQDLIISNESQLTYQLAGTKDEQPNPS